MSNYSWLLDFGHGGLTSDGKYTTAPGKMHVFGDGLTIYEGVINREIGYKLADRLSGGYIRHIIISEPVADTSLAERVKLINQTHKLFPNAIVLSIHSNAGGGKGFEVFTSIGQTHADVVAQIFCNFYQKHFKDKFPFRKDIEDGDDDKEANFYILRHTTCPAVLVENLFFDNREEAEYLLSEAGQNAIVDGLYEAIQEIEASRPI